MIRADDSDSIPIDLIIEILSRLPAKSIARFRYVSKLWESILLRPYFKELFLTRSSARPPRLLFAVERFDDWCFFTSPQPHNQLSSSLVVAADFHMKFTGDTLLKFCGHASGFLHFRRHTLISEEDKDPVAVPVICNPSTGQYASLPLPTRGIKWKSFLGFEPIDKQFKILSITIPNYNDEKEEPDQILTLGTGNQSWRKIHCPLNHIPTKEGICINGVLYYLANRIGLASMIVCFDVRSETFEFIYEDFISELRDTKLINYKGNLGVITIDHRWHLLNVYMWVINDLVKPQFLYRWDDDEVLHNYSFSIVGVTATTGEIVLSTNDASKPFYVFFLKPKRNNLQSVEIQSVEIRGFGITHFDNHSRVKRRRVRVFVDHVEDLEFISMKTTYTATSISPPEQKTTSTSSKDYRQEQDRHCMFESTNKFDSLRLLDDEE